MEHKEKLEERDCMVAYVFLGITDYRSGQVPIVPMTSFSRVLSPPRLITEEGYTYSPMTDHQGVRRSGTLDTFIMSQGTK